MLNKRIILMAALTLPLIAGALLPKPASADDYDGHRDRDRHEDRWRDRDDHRDRWRDRDRWNRDRDYSRGDRYNRGGGLFFGIGPVIVAPAPRGAGYPYYGNYGTSGRVWVPGHWEFSRYRGRYWIPGYYDYR